MPISKITKSLCTYLVHLEHGAGGHGGELEAPELGQVEVEDAAVCRVTHCCPRPLDVHTHILLALLVGSVQQRQNLRRLKCMLVLNHCSARRHETHVGIQSLHCT